jgi:hypothetical protein
MYAEDMRADRTRDVQPFLYTTRDRLEDIKQVLYGISEALGNAGFYPPPQGANQAEKPVENNVRQQLDDTISRIHETAATIREQVGRLT